MPYPLRTFTLIGLLVTLSYSTHAQDFFKDYTAYINSNPYKRYRKSKLANLVVAQQAFNLNEQQTHHSILNRDTIFMVDYFSIETGCQTTVVWSRSYSFRFTKCPKEGFKLKGDAQYFITGFNPAFKHWVETADTAAYNSYGKQSAWLDAPIVSFTTASKNNGHWRFVTSGGYANNVDKIGKQ